MIRIPDARYADIASIAPLSEPLFFDETENKEVALIVGEIGNVSVLEIEIEKAVSTLELFQYSEKDLVDKAFIFSANNKTYFVYRYNPASAKNKLKGIRAVKENALIPLEGAEVLKGSRFLFDAPDWTRIIFEDSATPILDHSREGLIRQGLKAGFVYLDKEKAMKHLKLINKELKPPFSDEELKTIFEREYVAKAPVEDRISNYSKFSNHDVAVNLIEEEKIRMIRGRLMAFSKGTYIPIERHDVGRLVVKNRFGRKVTPKAVKDIVEYLHYLAPRVDYDNTSQMVPFTNGVFSFKDFDLHPINPDLNFTFIIPHRYNKMTIEAAVKTELAVRVCELFVENGSMDLFCRILGFPLLHWLPPEYIIILIGPSKNGKSFLLELIEWLYGADNVSNVCLHDLEGNRFSAANLTRKLVNVFADLPSRPLSPTGNLKAITGRDKITVEEKWKQGRSELIKAKLVFSTNVMPEIKDSSKAFANRLVLFVLGKEIPPNKRIKNLSRILLEKQENRDALISMAIEGANRLLQDGIIFPVLPKSELELQKLFGRTNPVFLFAEKALEFGRKYSSNEDEIYREYCLFCDQAGMKQEPRDKVMRKLEDAYPVFKKQVYKPKERVFISYHEGVRIKC